MQLEPNEKFPNQWRILCFFCDNPEPHIEPYIQGKTDQHYWTCPICGTTYRFGRAMFFDVSGPVLSIKMPKSNEEVEYPMRRFNPETGFVDVENPHVDYNSLPKRKHERGKQYCPECDIELEKHHGYCMNNDPAKQHTFCCCGCHQFFRKVNGKWTVVDCGCNWG
jgi:hypothetical protein